MPLHATHYDEASEALLAHQHMTLNYGELLKKFSEIIGCQTVRMFEKVDEGWKELSRAEKMADSETIQSFDLETAPNQKAPYPTELFQFLEQSGQVSAKYASFIFNSNQRLQDLSSQLEVDIAPDYFKQTGIKSTLFIPVKHEDGTMWLLYLEDNDPLFFKENLLFFQRVFASILRVQMWRLKEHEESRIIEREDKSIIHDTRNAIEALQGAINMIMNLNQVIIEFLSQQKSDSALQKQAFSAASKIAKICTLLNTDLETDINQLQNALGSVSPELKSSPKTLKKRESSPQAIRTQFNVAEVLKFLVDEMLSAAQLQHKTIKSEISNTLDSIVCDGFKDKLISIMHNLINNAIQHGALNDEILVSVREEPAESEEQLKLTIDVKNKLPPSDMTMVKPAHPKRSGTNFGRRDVIRDIGFFSKGRADAYNKDNFYIATVSMELDKVKPTAAPQPLIKEKRVLIVEDNPIFIKKLTLFLHKYDSTIHLDCADTADKASQLILSSPAPSYDMIFIDNSLSDQSSGFDLAIKLRAEGIKSLLVWISSADLTRDQKAKNLFDHILLKSARMSKLEGILQELYPQSINEPPQPAASLTL